jgi:hypothetical protein
MRGKTFFSSLALVAGIALAGVGTPAQAGDLKVDVHLGYPFGHHYYGHRHGHQRWHYFKRHQRRHFGRYHPWPHRYRHYGHSQKRGYRPHRPRHQGGYRGRSGFGRAVASRDGGRRHGATTRMR